MAISKDPKVRADRVRKAGTVNVAPSVFKMIARSLEINEILYEKQFGKKFVNEYDKRAKSEEGDV